MQNRFLNSQAINFQPIQHGSSAGEMAGTSMANTGGMLGNAIMQYAQEKRKKEQEKAKKDEAAARFKAAQAVALEAGKKMGLIPEAEFRAAGKRGSAAASNLRDELKAAGFKCGVKQDGYSAINVVAPADADMERVKAICSKYKAGSFDGMSDCYDYDPCPWGSVFGDVQYVFVRGE